jgi:hypothetical protein
MKHLQLCAINMQIIYIRVNITNIHKLIHVSYIYVNIFNGVHMGSHIYYIHKLIYPIYLSYLG